MPLRKPRVPVEGEQPIRSLREKRNLTQAEVADAANIGREEYSRIENGIWIVSLDMLDTLCRLLRAKPAQLFSAHILAELDDRRKKVQA